MPRLMAGVDSVPKRCKMSPGSSLTRALVFAAALYLGSAVPAVVHAAELKMAFSAEPTSTDPHWHGHGPNYALARHIYDRLVTVDEHMRPVPELATAWRRIDDTTWEFDLRPGVKFQDGTPLTPEDVVFTFDRAQNVTGSPASLKGYIRGMKVEVVNDHQVRIKTDKPDPLVINEITAISIVSKTIGGTATTEDYNRGKAAIGTGPYKFVEWVQGDRIVLVRNEHYWGVKPEWDKVTIKFITSGPARIAALLSGDIDFIENVPATDYKRLKADPKIHIEEAPANRIFYLAMDQFRKTSPFVKGPRGEAIENPFLNPKVRIAMSKAIDREAITELLLSGAGDTAAQLVLPFFSGIDPAVKPMAYAPDEAKKLLAEAGYPNGFTVTLHGSNDQYINDDKIQEALGQMLSSIGIVTKVDAMPGSVFYRRVSSGGANRTPEFSLYFNGFGGQVPDASGALSFLIHSYDPEKGYGNANRARFSDPAMDALIEKAASTMDDAARAKLQTEAMTAVVDRQIYIPLYNQHNIWAMRKGLAYKASIEEQSLAFRARREQ
jgi:peptide/nickel transport system substrate-binding protein